MRYGARMLLKNPGFTLIAIITLSLGIGANTAIFSIIDGLVLRPLPGIKDPERLVAVFTSEYNGGPYGSSSYLDYLDFCDQAKAFSSLAAYAERTLILTGVDQAERLRGDYVTGNYFATLGVDGYEPHPNEDLELNFNVVGLNYFRTMGITLVRGRDFNAQDTAGSPPVAIVNEELARRYFPGQNPIGKRLRFTISHQPMEIVGVTRLAKYSQLREASLPFIYIPLAQDFRGDLNILVRTIGDPAAIVPAVRSEIHHLNSDVAVASVRTMSEQIGMMLATDRMLTVFLGIFGGIALLLAVVGIYGVMSYAVSQRIREIGIRLALGSQTVDVLRLVIGQGMKLVVIGIALGLSMSFALTRLVASLLFNVSATDPVMYAVITLLLMTVAAIACYLPARRATRVDPMVALRVD